MVALCPEHGLHGERAKCFVCGGPVEQVAYVAHGFHQRFAAELRAENEALRLALADVIEGETAEEGTPMWYALRNARALLRPASDEQEVTP